VTSEPSKELGHAKTTLTGNERYVGSANSYEGKKEKQPEKKKKKAGFFARLFSCK
jgi:hypothetical protein